MSFPELDVPTPVHACCYCAPEELGGFIDVTAHDAHMINMQDGEVTLILRREERSYFWEVIGVEPLAQHVGVESLKTAEARI